VVRDASTTANLRVRRDDGGIGPGAGIGDRNCRLKIFTVTVSRLAIHGYCGGGIGEADVFHIAGDIEGSVGVLCCRCVTGNVKV
jgi:hypothetical protein